MLSNQELFDFLVDNYHINSKYTLQSVNLGTGKNYVIKENDVPVYFVKTFNEDSIYENIQEEIATQKILISENYPTPHFIKNKNGELLTKIDDKTSLIVQEWVNGRTPDKFTLTIDQSKFAIKLLAKANILLKNLQFKTRFLDLFDNIKKRKEECKQFIRLFHENGRTNQTILSILNTKIDCFELLERLNLEMDKFTYVNSHGDYNCLQLMMENSQIKYVVDFSRVARVPAIWEIIRFYSFADPVCKDCKMNEEYLNQLICEYEKYLPLTNYDKKNAYIMYALQILSSHFGYKQYIEKDNSELLDFAIWRVEYAYMLLEKSNIIA